MTLAAEVQRAILLVGVTVVSVSIGDPADKSTWMVTHLPTATQADVDAAKAAIVSFDPANAATIADAKAQDAAVIDTDRLLQAVAAVTWQELQKCQTLAGQTLLTGAQFKAAIRTAYKNLLP